MLIREGNVLFNDALNTFYLRLYGIRGVDTSITITCVSLHKQIIFAL